MQATTFARTKIQAPRFRTGLIERVSLEKRFGAALLGMRLVLVAAPAGYGKTAALARQLALLPQGSATAWITADEDDDLPRFLSCLAEALEPFDPAWRQSPEVFAAGALGERGMRDAAAELINALSGIAVPRGVIALDDMHSVGDPAVLAFIGLLVDGLPEHWTVAMATRVDPPLALSRLRARRELGEFRQADLRFTREDIARLFGDEGGAEVDAAVEHMFERTQGWPVGVTLSFDALSGGLTSPDAEKAGERHLFDYLATEVFGQMPEELKDFLMCCSVLPELTAGRCAVVSGNPRAVELLEDIERRGLFIVVLDSEELTLRLHDLFRDFLDHRLRRLHPEQLPLLLRRAAEGESDPVRKLNLLMRAGAWIEGETALAEATSRMLAAGNGAQVLRLIDQFPAEARKASPQLAYARGLWGWAQLEFEIMKREMAGAAAGFDAAGRPVDAQRARFYLALAHFWLSDLDGGLRIAAVPEGLTVDRESAVIGELLAFWYTGVKGPTEGAAKHLARLVDLLAGAPAELWYICTPAPAPMLGRPGVGAAGARFVEGALIAAGDVYVPLQAQAHVFRAWLLLWRGRLGEAFEVIERLRSDAKWLGHPNSLIFKVWILRAQYAAMRHDAGLVRELFEDGEMITATEFVRPYATMRGLCSAAIDDWEEVERLLPVIGDAQTWPFWGIFRVTLEARLALARDRIDDVIALLRPVALTSPTIDRFGYDASIRITLAIAELRSGDSSAAWSTIEPLIELVAASGEVGGALLCGPAWLRELADGAWGIEVTPAARGEMRRWAELARQLGLKSHAAGMTRIGVGNSDADRSAPGGASIRMGSTAVLPLSARELEVLARIAIGDSNKLIARALDLSPHTVKRHVARILDRLDLNSRGAAANWYRTHPPG